MQRKHGTSERVWVHIPRGGRGVSPLPYLPLSMANHESADGTLKQVVDTNHNHTPTAIRSDPNFRNILNIEFFQHSITGDDRSKLSEF